ncbi:MAG TPA: His/Gly/Thr/Pro-type tRNA ligase C-terminal domain-containing protein, partial [Bacteroidales bacterium]|nr:His/Gly/Thr/Pro-type tRNA ligase C-terminal domain-containing protein [Bacteroidales bacterium]
INQWANVVRWEMRTRLFLRTTEFLWQEGHTAHATMEEAQEEAIKMLGVYADFAENFMALPVIRGVKTESEKFAGAIDTYTIEALMQDGKALQGGTSHFLGQNFAKAFDVQFTNQEGKLDYVWATSWGVTTRLIGALIMAHADNHGLVLPPRLAPLQVVIIPIYKGNEQLGSISEIATDLKGQLEKAGLSVKYDDRDTQKPGFKFADYELKGVPVRLAIGPRDAENGTVEVARRDTLTKETISRDNVVTYVTGLMEEIHKNIYRKAVDFRTENTYTADSWDEFRDIIENKGGFVMAHWDGTAGTEEQIKNLTKATIRAIPFDTPAEEGKCILTGKPSHGRVLFARAY